MPKTKGATDVNQRTRRTATQSELAKKQAVRDAKAERKRVADQKKATKAKQSLLAAMGAAPAPTANKGNNVAAAEPGEYDNAAGASAGAGGEGGESHSEDSEDDGEKDGNSGQDARREARPADVEAELDEDEQLDESVANGSVMGAYLKAVFDRLHSETIGDASRSALEAKWLLDMLKQEGADWWLPASSARLVCAKLGVEYGEPAYYRDIKVWLPDEQWGSEAMPPCVECESAAEVGVHGFHDSHFGRRVCGLASHYFVISRRYICHYCKRKAKEAKATAEAAGLDVQEEEERDAANPPQYTFMGYDARSRARLPHGYGEDFPAFLTHRGGVDTQCVDLMRPLFDKGLRPEALSATLLELHTKAYTKAYEKREHRLKRDRRLQPDLAAEMFSEFGDAAKYAGLVPSGRYLSTVYKQYEASIADHLSKEVKKRGARRLHWDASYKEAKHLARYHGESIFKALITATNEVGPSSTPPSLHTFACAYAQAHLCAPPPYLSTCMCISEAGRRDTGSVPCCDRRPRPVRGANPSLPRHDESVRPGGRRAPGYRQSCWR